MSTFFKVQTRRTYGITSVLKSYSIVLVNKELVPVKTIGFYIVSLVGKVIFKEINVDESKLAELKSEYEDIKNRREQLVADGAIDKFYKKTIMDMSERVLTNIAAGYENIRRSGNSYEWTGLRL